MIGGENLKKIVAVLMILLIALGAGLLGSVFFWQAPGFNLQYAVSNAEYVNNNLRVTVREIEGHEKTGEVLFRGHVMTVNDPGAVKVMLAQGGLGNLETTSSMAKRVGAVAAINGGGFYIRQVPGKPLYYPLYYTVQGGSVVSQVSKYSSEILVGLTKNGTLVGGSYANPAAVSQAGIVEGVSFQPQLIKNGKGLRKPGGLPAPRTAIGQKKDGTLLLVVIDGRRPGWSSGVTYYQLQEVLLKLGAYNAFNLDGGGSSTMVFNNQVMNKPSDDYGERRVATSLVVLDKTSPGNGGGSKPAGELITNGNFSSNLAGWNVGNSGVIRVDANGNKYAANSYNWRLGQDLLLQPGQRYVISAQTRKGNATTAARIFVTGINSSGKLITANQLDSRHNHHGTGWESFKSAEFTVPAGAVKTRIYLLTNGGAGNHHFDNISVKAAS